MMARSRNGEPRGGFSNILRNLAWLLGGKGFGAVCSIVYLAILSRSLGLKDFGHFSLILGTGQALVALASFQAWQTIVKFGAGAVHEGDWARFGRLAFLCGAIDLGGALLCTLLAAVIYYGFGALLGLNPAFVDMAFAFNVALLWGRLTTPNGILRVLDRFDLSIYVEALVPAGRLIASFVIILTGASVARFLFAWAFFDLLAGLVYWIVAWRLVPHALNRDNFGQWRRALDENKGLRGFMAITYAGSTLDAVMKQGPLLAVGLFLGTSAAGLYRLADQLAQGISRFAGMIPRVVFPELAKAQIGERQQAFGSLVRKVVLMTGGAGLAVALVALLLGRQLTGLVGGEEFVDGGAILLPIAIGASFELAAIAFEPILLSTGHPARALAARVLALAVLGAGILLFVPFGPVGVSWAVALALAVFYAATSVTVWLVLRGMRRKGLPV